MGEDSEGCGGFIFFLMKIFSTFFFYSLTFRTTPSPCCSGVGNLVFQWPSAWFSFSIKSDLALGKSGGEEMHKPSLYFLKHGDHPTVTSGAAGFEFI